MRAPPESGTIDGNARPPSAASCNSKRARADMLRHQLWMLRSRQASRLRGQLALLNKTTLLPFAATSARGDPIHYIE